MTITSGDKAAPPMSGGIPRRTLLAMGVGGAAALVARPVGAGASSPTTPATRGEVAGDWFDQVVVTTAGFNPPGYAQGVSDRMWAICWMSALTAVGASGHPRSFRARGRFEEAAVATAVHDALAGLVPDQAGRLDSALLGSLAAIPDGDAKQAGIAAGQAAAVRILAEREGDGFDPASLNRPFTPPPEAPGVYRPPPGATATVGAGQSAARPFLLARADQFRPGAPPALGTEGYRQALVELYRLGGVASERTEHQSDIAWLAPGMQFTPALGALVRAPGRSLGWKVRLLAAYATASVDAGIAVADGKFTYLHWRPVTAIRAADTDGDPRTDPDPTWTSYLPTPPNPEWPSGHGAGAGAGERVLEHFCGPRTPVPFAATYIRGDGKVVTLDYPRGTRWSRLTQENVDARVWAGVHFRFSDEVGATLGRRVGAHAVQRLDRLHPRTSDR